MRCPQCSQWNRASLPRCIRCGTELSTTGPVTPSWRAELKDDRQSKEYIRVDEAGDIDELEGGGGVLLGVVHLGQHVEAMVRNGDDAGVGLDGAEGIVGRLCACAGDGIKERGLADIGQSDNAKFHRKFLQ